MRNDGHGTRRPSGLRIKSATSLRHGRIQQVLGVACPCHPVDTAMRQHDGTSTMWIDESLVNLYEILGFQPEGVATLSFSSR